MEWFNNLFSRPQPKSSAQQAKERLLIAVQHNRSGVGDRPKYFPELQRDLLRVIRKYVHVGDDAVKIDFAKDEVMDAFQISISLPEKI